MKQQQVKQFQAALIDVLKKERKKAGLSHERLAEKAGVTRQTIGKIESGMSNPPMVTMYKITSALDIPLDAFVRRMKVK